MKNLLKCNNIDTFKITFEKYFMNIEMIILIFEKAIVFFIEGAKNIKINSKLVIKLIF